MIKKIIFDLYGTIVEGPASWDIYLGLLKDVGVHLQERTVRDYCKRIALTRNHKGLREFLIDLHVNPHDYEEVIKNYQSKLDEAVATVKPRKYAYPALKHLNALGIESFVLSNATRTYADAFNKTTLAPLVSGSMFSCYAGMMKPDSEFFLKLLVSYDLYVNEAVMIGDSRVSDIAGAHGIGLKARSVAANPYDVLRVLRDEKFLNDKDIEKIVEEEGG